MMISPHQEKVSRCRRICQVSKWCKGASTSPSIVSRVSVRLCPLIVQLEWQQMQHKDQVPKEKWSQSNQDYAHLDCWGLYIWSYTSTIIDQVYKHILHWYCDYTYYCPVHDNISNSLQCIQDVNCNWLQKHVMYNLFMHNIHVCTSKWLSIMQLNTDN